MRVLVTTLLDVIGLLVVAAGAAVAVGEWLGWGFGLILAGVLVLAGSWWAARQGLPREGAEAR